MQSMDRKLKAAITRTLDAELAAVRALKGSLDERFFKAVDTLAAREGNIIVTGLGKSSFVAMKMAASLTSFGIRAHFINPVEAMHGDAGNMEPGGVLVAFSSSGATAEVVRFAKYAKTKMQMKVIVITAKPRSPLGVLADHIVPLTITDEGSPESVAPMASVTASLVASDLLISGLLARTEFSKHRFAQFHPGGSLGLSLAKVEDAMHTGKHVPLVASDAKLGEALRVMSAKRLGIVGVTDAKGRLAGVVTDGDVRRFLMKKQNSAGTAPVTEAMTARPKSVKTDASLKDALAIMEKHRITALFILDAAKKPTGVLHIHDLLG